jgi:hypothetical protein
MLKKEEVILEVPRVSLLCHFKNEVTFKIIIGLAIDYY